MLYGAVTNKKNQKMGKGNYVLASHIISNSNLLFTS
ncbi:TPA: class A sortase, partial [Enterococcus faecalis]|nr:class A sortase [Enterococcus faecalis]